MRARADDPWSYGADGDFMTGTFRPRERRPHVHALDVAAEAGTDRRRRRDQPAALEQADLV